MKPTLHMLIGLPGSGKSTFCRYFDGYRLSTDDYIELVADYSGKTYNEVFQENIKAATARLDYNLYAALHHESNIIWDQTNLTKKSRATKLAKIPDEYEKIAYVFRTPLWEILQRNEDRKAIGRAIPDNVLQDMLDNYVEPGWSEGFDKIYIIKGE